MITVFVLLVLFQLKHFLADYPLQRPWMLGKFKNKGWVPPLAAHCAVHAVFTVFIGFLCGWVPTGVVLLMGAVDFCAHFTMDRIKASKRLLGRFEPLNAYQYMAVKDALDGVAGAFLPVEEAKARLRSNRWYWHSLGIDQAVHHLTHYAIIFVYLCCCLPFLS
jgi:hypothetical protein